jgi:hypothetical protein
MRFLGLAGGALAATETIGTLGLGAPAGVAITIGGNVVGSSAGRYVGGLIYKGVKMIDTNIELNDEANRRTTVLNMG